MRAVAASPYGAPPYNNPTFTGQSLFAAGTAGAPSVAVGETTTGLFLVAPGDLGISISGAKIFEFTQNAMSPYANNFVDIGDATFRFRMVYANAYTVGTQAGIDATVTTADLVGKTLTIVKGIIVGYA